MATAVRAGKRRASSRRAAPPEHPTTAYALDVVEGRVVAGPWVRLACKRHLEDLKHQAARGLAWRPELADKVFEFFRGLLKLEGGVPFEPLPFQLFILGSLFGWYRLDGTRRFRTAYVETGKGSGKTPLAAGIGLYCLILDDEPAPEVYSAATMKDQAAIAWRDAKRMVEAEPELLELVSVQVASLTIPASVAVFRPVSSEARGLDGLRPHCGLIDELHEHPTGTVVDKIRAGIKRRRNALILEITNSGFDRTSVCWAHHEYSIRVLEGTDANDTWFAFVCALDDGDEWTDERVWEKANPGVRYGLPPASYLRDQVTEAQGMPSKENIVRRLNFCEWTEQADRWLDMAAWDACPADPVPVEALRGRAVMAGLDAASVSDLCSLVVTAQADDGAVDVFCRFWIPARSLEVAASKRSEADRLRLLQWVDEGWITATDGNTTDYDQVEAECLEVLGGCELRRLSYDRWNVTQLVTHLERVLGDDRVVNFAQTLGMMTAPCHELERLVRDGKLRHGGNPVLRWMASNVALQMGPNETCKPDKVRSGEKIDGVVGLVMSLDGWMREAGDEDAGGEPGVWGA